MGAISATEPRSERGDEDRTLDPGGLSPPELGRPAGCAFWFPERRFRPVTRLQPRGGTACPRTLYESPTIRSKSSDTRSACRTLCVNLPSADHRTEAEAPALPGRNLITPRPPSCGARCSTG